MKYAILSFLILITMCEKEDDQTSCINEPISTDTVCIEIYEPVCGCNDTTYSNTCYAAASGVSTWTEGECSD
ncbi:MAG: hypothetical protein ACPHUE_07465 [Flavobacteriaceae bacterium]